MQFLLEINHTISIRPIEIPALSAYVEFLIRQSDQQKQIDALKAEVVALAARLHTSESTLAGAETTKP